MALGSLGAAGRNWDCSATACVPKDTIQTARFILRKNLTLRDTNTTKRTAVSSYIGTHQHGVADLHDTITNASSHKLHNHPFIASGSISCKVLSALNCMAVHIICPKGTAGWAWTAMGWAATPVVTRVMGRDGVLSWRNGYRNGEGGGYGVHLL